ncbi:glutathione S-transferase-like [Contarinia nasturtii]|uniref:glutathione S-transferase-like n=1 Tax=Contarinia nasturtii TaxID=265458 RepID=UPI0012D40C1E|nr:glutathione S-transferase-like [Contarinia nasturtii]XP_031619644.1 glutathione S-transferase-like [Contarinia nasturtii]
MSEPSENPTYKFYYFNFRGLGEPIRLLLAYGGIEYEDVRIPKEEWPEHKPTMPLHQMPVLEIDESRVYQHVSILRYLGKKVGLSGESDWENLQIDMVADIMNEFRLKLVGVYQETDEEIKAKKLEDIKNETIPLYLGKLDGMVEENNGYLVAGKLTWVDVYLAGISDLWKLLAGYDVAADYSNLQNAIENVNSIETIKNWIENRPETEF